MHEYTHQVFEKGLPQRHDKCHARIFHYPRRMSGHVPHVLLCKALHAKNNIKLRRPQGSWASRNQLSWHGETGIATRLLARLFAANSGVTLQLHMLDRMITHICGAMQPVAGSSECCSVSSSLQHGAGPGLRCMTAVVHTGMCAQHQLSLGWCGSSVRQGCLGLSRS